MNRQWYDKPLQGGGRDGYGYGHTDLPYEPRDLRLLVAALLTSALIVGGLLVWAWHALDAL